MFYLGLLTIKGPEKNKLYLEIPNETVQRLYYNYIEEAEEQLKRCAGDDKFKKTIGQTTVVKLVLIFRGNELEYIGKAK